MAKDKKLSAHIDQYYKKLAEFEFQYALHEGAVSAAFQTLLADAARPHHWTLIPQLSDKKSGKSIRPDGTLKDPMGLVRGHAEIGTPEGRAWFKCQTPRNIWRMGSLFVSFF